ncbi:hypothetical protein PROFUN_16334 [Planoprotostelium fungivorum]|uniref:Uncharacterized protein n=1 Tax=Planoprotostelium fungivorum TaxID=1890364 RepID=A0A2P6MR86_9EUKA|nr:hypothetical protein PROFUN_16334 [Planoprotostelium fungivorum]
MWGVKDIQKELFPYEQFDSLDKNALPSETEYEHAVKVWKDYANTYSCC